MSLGWSWHWKGEQDSSFHHTLCLQVKRIGKLNKILIVTSGLKIAGPLCDNQGAFKMLWGVLPVQLWDVGFSNLFFYQHGEKRIVMEYEEHWPHRPIVACSLCSSVSAHHTVCEVQSCSQVTFPGFETLQGMERPEGIQSFLSWAMLSLACLVNHVFWHRKK